LSPPAPRWTTGVVAANEAVAAGLLRLDLELPRPAAFAPGQFAMLNLLGPLELVFGRPLSILDADGRRLSFLYRVVGEGTARLAQAKPGDPVACFAPLGRPFPPPGEAPCLLLAGGVGLPPLWAWRRRHGRPADLACFGARSGDDVPWGLVPPPWRVSVERAEGAPSGRAAAGTVVELATALLAEFRRDGRRPPAKVLACGPLPMLRAAARLAAGQGWECLVSVEERMGCGYGVCRGCVVPAAAGHYLTACQEGPVLAASEIDWERFERSAAGEIAGVAPLPAAAADDGAASPGSAPAAGRGGGGARE